MNLIGIASLISALLVIDHFVKYPIDWNVVKAHITRFWQYCLKGDAEDLRTYLWLCFSLVVVVVVIIEYIN